MLSHVVLLRFLPGVDAGSEAVQALDAALQALPAEIPQILGWQCGFNVVPDALAADYVLLATFSGEEELLAYFDHPAHLAVLTQIEALATLQFGDLVMRQVAV